MRSISISPVSTALSHIAACLVALTAHSTDAQQDQRKCPKVSVSANVSAPRSATGVWPAYGHVASALGAPRARDRLNPGLRGPTRGVVATILEPGRTSDSPSGRSPAP